MRSLATCSSWSPGKPPQLFPTENNMGGDSGAKACGEGGHTHSFFRPESNTGGDTPAELPARPCEGERDP